MACSCRLPGDGAHSALLSCPRVRCLCRDGKGYRSDSRPVRPRSDARLRLLRRALAAIWLLWCLGGVGGVGPRLHAKSARRQRLRLVEAATRAPRGAFDMEIVIARYSEQNLTWLEQVPDFYHITIYDKGGKQHAMPALPLGRVYDIFHLPNIGREANTFAEHLVRRYDSLASYTIFCQADPFVHNAYYLDLLRTPTLLGTVQTMSRVYKQDGDWRYKTPKEVVAKMSKHPWYRSERLSTRTLNSIWYHDQGTLPILNGYRKEQRLEQGVNLIRHHFGLMGLPDWIPEHQEVGSFAFGGMVGFERSKALQHPKECYEKLLRTTREPKQQANAWMIERMWVMMFGGPDFRDV